LVSRSNEMDFSDLFILSEMEYEQLLADWAATAALDWTESYDTNDVNYIGYVSDFSNPDSLAVRGPYGPSWPFITEPTEFEIGDATVRIELEDENAKYPVGWMLLSDRKVKREALAGFEIFCEWMKVDAEQIDPLESQLEQIVEIKPFTVNLKPIIKKETVRTRTTRGVRTKTVQKTISVSEQAASQAVDFAKLFHSSLIDTEVLARPAVASESRKESALKYMGMWGSRKVNINTAPRHVLEAAFAFGGDAEEIAEEIIQRRRMEPFKSVSDLKKSLFEYSDSIEKCKQYIITVSNFFTIRVSAVSGLSKASAVIAIMKDKGKIRRIAVISG